MQAVILAAGRGKRLKPITDDRPKPMVELLGRPILEYVIDFLPEKIDEVVIIVGYKGETIREHFGNSWEGRPIVYVEQGEPKGTAHALFTAKPAIRSERFLILPGDNISEFKVIDNGLSHDYVVFACEHEHPERFGVIELNDDGKTLKRIQEKPDAPPSNLISTACMILSPGIFDCEMVLHPRLGEYFIPDLLNQVLEKEPIYVLKQDFWIPVDRPEDIPAAEAELLKHGLPR